MFEDPSKRQYLVFSAILSLIFSALISFVFFGVLEGPIISGFPISVTELQGIARLLAQLFNTVILGILLTVPMYYFLDWLRAKAGGI